MNSINFNFLLPYKSEFLSTLLLFVFLSILRFIIVSTVNKSTIKNIDLRRRWIVQARNFTITIFLLGIIFIWGEQLKAFAVSIVAFAVALVIATKELILCFLGGILRTSSNAFEIGDRIEVDSHRGDVISVNLFTTTLNEIGPGKLIHQFTGRTITIPNSLFLSNNIINETATGRYVLHTFSLPFNRTEPIQNIKDKLLEIAKNECEDAILHARKQFERMSKKEGLEVPVVEPRIWMAFKEKNQIELFLRIPTESHKKGRVEQKILSQFWTYYQSLTSSDQDSSQLD